MCVCVSRHGEVRKKVLEVPCDPAVGLGRCQRANAAAPWSWRACPGRVAPGKAIRTALALAAAPTLSPCYYREVAGRNISAACPCKGLLPMHAPRCSIAPCFYGRAGGGVRFGQHVQH